MIICTEKKTDVLVSGGTLFESEPRQPILWLKFPFSFVRGSTSGEFKGQLLERFCLLDIYSMKIT